MGSTKPILLQLMQELYEWALARHVQLSEAHIPGRLNRVADEKSSTHNVHALKLNDASVQGCIMSRISLAINHSRTKVVHCDQTWPWMDANSFKCPYVPVKCGCV